MTYFIFKVTLAHLHTNAQKTSHSLTLPN